MAVLYISEYADMRYLAGYEPAIATQTVSVGGSSVQSAVFNEQTKFVRVHTDVVCSVLFGVNPTATTSSPRLAAGQTEYFAVRAPLDAGSRLRLAVISNT